MLWAAKYTLVPHQIIQEMLHLTISSSEAIISTSAATSTPDSQQDKKSFIINNTGNMNYFCQSY